MILFLEMPRVLSLQNKNRPLFDFITLPSDLGNALVDNSTYYDVTTCNLGAPP